MKWSVFAVLLVLTGTSLIQSQDVIIKLATTNNNNNNNGTEEDYYEAEEQYLEFEASEASAVDPKGRTYFSQSVVGNPFNLAASQFYPNLNMTALEEFRDRLKSRSTGNYGKASVSGLWLKSEGGKSYRKRKVIWNDKRVGSSPAIIIEPVDEQDMAEAVKFSRNRKSLLLPQPIKSVKRQLKKLKKRENSYYNQQNNASSSAFEFNNQEFFDLPVRIKSGGHSFTGWSQAENGITISTHKLRTLTFDTCNDTVTIGAGHRLGDVYREASKRGYLFVGGTCPTVGVSGYTLGGGHSLLGRSYGLGADQLVSMKVVTAKGEIVKVSDRENADLFWAMRGAGNGNFAIATEYTFKLIRATRKSLFGLIHYLLTTREDSYRITLAFANFVTTMPRNLGMQFNYASGNFIILYLWNGPKDQGVETVNALIRCIEEATENGRRPTLHRQQEGTQFDMVKMYDWVMSTYPLPLRAYFKSAYFREPPTRASVTHLIDTLRELNLFQDGVIMTSFVIFTGGGSIKEDYSADATAYPHRDTLFSMEFGAQWISASADQRIIAKIAEAAAGLENVSGSYLNYPDEYREDWEHAYYGSDENYEKLQRIKAKWDPDNFFNYAHSVRPRFD